MSVRSDHQKRIDEFMLLADQELPLRPTVPCVAVRKLRATIILEEALETISGLGFLVYQDLHTGAFKVTEAHSPSIVDVVDGCADLSVVSIGTLSAFGVSDESILGEVDAANLRKFGPGSYKRLDGKWVKPHGFKPPDVMSILIEQGYVA